MLAMVLISLFIMPFLNNLSIFNSGEVRPFYRSLCFVFFVNYIILGILGSKLVMFPYVEIGKLCTFIFFLFFFFIFFLGFFENIFFVVNNLKNDNVDKKNINKGGEYLLFSLDNLNNFFKK
jgi:quinol-cytochrome oxidoreductase complex cytochrome b subunit